jgi:xylulokinase
MSVNLLAIDIGTQSARAAILTDAGEIRGIAQIPHEVDSPHPGWAQQKADDWWAATCRAIREVLEQTGVDPATIAAAASCGQMHGPVGLDQDGNVTHEWVQLWCDKRCADQVARVCRDHDEERLAAIAGSANNPAWIGNKVRWHKDNEPEVYRRSQWFLVPKDFINFRLTGVAAADSSEQSASFLWDAERDAYSEELAEAVGVDLAKFAPVYPSHEIIGKVTAAASRETGLVEGTPVVAGGGDFPVSMLGFGIVGEGVTADVTGTSTLLAAHTARPLRDPAIQNLRHVVDGWIPFTILDCGGLSITWCRDLVGSFRGEEISYDDLVSLAESAPIGSDGLLFYPYMLGERRRENTTARGGYVGVELGHSASHFVRAVMESVALAMAKDVAQFEKHGHRVERIQSVGGGTRNQLLNRIKANAVGVPLEMSDEPEAGLKGVALLAARGIGLIDDPARVALERRKALRQVDPDPEAVEAYRPVLKEFVRTYEHLLGFWREEQNG